MKRFAANSDPRRLTGQRKGQLLGKQKDCPNKNKVRARCGRFVNRTAGEPAGIVTGTRPRPPHCSNGGGQSKKQSEDLKWILFSCCFYQADRSNTGKFLKKITRNARRIIAFGASDADFRTGTESRQSHRVSPMAIPGRLSKAPAVRG